MALVQMFFIGKGLNAFKQMELKDLMCGAIRYEEPFHLLLGMCYDSNYEEMISIDWDKKIYRVIFFVNGMVWAQTRGV